MKRRYLVFLLMLLMTGCLFVACEKETAYLYEVNTVSVQQSGSIKSNAKSTTEFITIAWADLFGAQIPQQELVKLNTVYSAFGDKKLMEDRILLNMLNKPGNLIPAAPHVNGDTLFFIQNTYKKLYNRDPDAFETFYLKEQIRLNPTISATLLWYALMSSDEYRYY